MIADFDAIYWHKMYDFEWNTSLNVLNIQIAT